MTPPKTPNLAQPHSLVRSRTPEERNAARAALFRDKIAAKEAATTAKNAQPKAGQNVTVNGTMISAQAGGARSSGTLEFIGDSNGTLVYFNLEGKITGTVQEE